MNKWEKEISKELCKFCYGCGRVDEICDNQDLLNIIKREIKKAVDEFRYYENIDVQPPDVFIKRGIE